MYQSAVRSSVASASVPRVSCDVQSNYYPIVAPFGLVSTQSLLLSSMLNEYAKICQLTVSFRVEVESRSRSFLCDLILTIDLTPETQKVLDRIRDELALKQSAEARYYPAVSELQKATQANTSVVIPGSTLNAIDLGTHVASGSAPISNPMTSALDPNAVLDLKAPFRGSKMDWRKGEKKTLDVAGKANWERSGQYWATCTATVDMLGEKAERELESREQLLLRMAQAEKTVKEGAALADYQAQCNVTSIYLSIYQAQCLCMAHRYDWGLVSLYERDITL